jgi:hypothetical protein
MIRLRSTYLIIAILLFLVEILIALFVHDRYFRRYVGDFLVVILIYCFIRGFFNVPVVATSLGTLLFAFLLEALQYFKLVELLGFGNSKLARVIIGSSFEWIDIMAYTLGVIVVLVIEGTISFRNIKRLRTT